MAAVPPTDPSSFSPIEPPLIQRVIDIICPQFLDVEAIHFESINDEDQNYRISLVLNGGEKEPASIFSLKDKDEPTLVRELKLKIDAHLSNRAKTDLITFESGAMLENNTDVTIKALGGRLIIDGKVAVLERDAAYVPLPTPLIDTYTLLRATQEANILKLSDDYDQERKDDKEGFLFALDQVYNDPEIGSCLILYRNRGQIPT